MLDELSVFKWRYESCFNFDLQKMIGEDNADGKWPIAFLDEDNHFALTLSYEIDGRGDMDGRQPTTF